MAEKGAFVYVLQGVENTAFITNAAATNASQVMIQQFLDVILEITL